MTRKPKTSKPIRTPLEDDSPSHADEACTLAAKLKRVFPRRTDWQICSYPRTQLDALAVRRFSDTSWCELPDWVVQAHRDTIPSLTNRALLALAPAFMRCALADWRAENELVEMIAVELCSSHRLALKPEAFVPPLLRRERHFVLDFLTLVARTPAFESFRATIVEGIREWKALAREGATNIMDEAPSHITLRRRDFTPIASANVAPLAVLVQDIALDSVSLTNADLSRIQLPDAYLPRVSFINADLSGANLRGANLEWADLENTVLDGADLRGANLAYCRLNGASIQNAHLDGVYAPYAIFDYATLRGSSFERAHLHSAHFVGVDFESARFEGASMLCAYIDLMNDQCVSFDGADLRASTLSANLLDEDEVHAAEVSFPVLRVAPLELVGKPFDNIRWRLAVSTEEIGPRTVAHGTYTIKLRPDYTLHFYTRSNSRTCGFRIEHPAGRSREEVLRWAGCKDTKKLERAYKLDALPGTTLVHARACNHRHPPTLSRPMERSDEA